MVQKRVFIVSQYPLFDAGLQAALGRQPEIKVVGVCRSDLEVAYVQTQAVHPDVVLLIAGPEAVRQCAHCLLEVADSVIRVDTVAGFMQVYRRQHVNHATLDHLMAAIQFVRETVDEDEQSGAGGELAESHTEVLYTEVRNRNHDCEYKSSGNHRVNP